MMDQLRYKGFTGTVNISAEELTERVITLIKGSEDE